MVSLTFLLLGLLCFPLLSLSLSHLNLILDKLPVLFLSLLVQALNFRHHLVVVLDNLLFLILLLDQLDVFILLVLLYLFGQVRPN